MSLRLLLCCLTFWLTLFELAIAEEVVQVRDATDLKSALARIKPGTVLRLAPGDYPGGHSVQDVANLTVEAADPDKPPHFQGGSYAWHFSGCSGLKLRNLQISGQSHNGLNLDDGGDADRPMKDVTLEHLAIRDIGPKGNFDGIKCSGLEDLTISNCTVEGWGGEAIDLVGCHRVLISAGKFTGKQGYSQAS